MSDLERFLHDERAGLPVLIKTALAHVQFETIHPFLDGNGRVGRLLITLFLRRAGLLREPLLYLSLYFKQHREEYYRLLEVVRKEGDWEAWLAFFLDGVVETGDGAVATARRLVQLFQEDRARIQTRGRKAGLRVARARSAEGPAPHHPARGRPARGPFLPCRDGVNALTRRPRRRPRADGETTQSSVRVRPLSRDSERGNGTGLNGSGDDEPT